jgi:hypothetical protein
MPQMCCICESIACCDVLCVCSQDGEIRKLFQRSLQKQGMKFKLNTKVRVTQQ